MAAQPVSVLAIQASHALQLVEQLRADLQRALQELPSGAFLSPDADLFELSWALGSVFAAERSVLTARQFLQSVADRQPAAPCAKVAR